MSEKYVEWLQKNELLISKAIDMQVKNGFINIDELYNDEEIKQFYQMKEYVKYLVSKISDKIQANIISFKLLPLEDIKREYINKFNAFKVKILECRKKITPDSENYTGKLLLRNQAYKYVSLFELRTGDCIIYAIPTFINEKKNKHDLVFEVYGFLDQYIEQRMMSTNTIIQFNSLEDIRKMYVKVVDEDVNIAVMILSIISRLNKLRDFWIMGIVLQGQSSSGKSYLIDNVLKPFRLLDRVEEFSRFTGAYLERKFVNRNLDDVILIVYELFENTPQQLHIMLSEGKLRVGIVDKETGQPIEYEFQGMPLLFSTTPLEGLREDLKNRIINLSIDESDEQTKNIISFETRLAQDIDFASKINSQNDENMNLLARYFASLKPYYVVTPFADILEKALTFYSVKLRRDWKKLLSLIQSSTLLFQNNRPKLKINGEEVLVSTVEDFDNLLYIIPAFIDTLTDVTKSERRLLDLMNSGEQTEYTRQELTMLVRRNGWNIGYQRVRRILEELVNKGLVIEDDSKKPYKYMVADSYRVIDFTKLREEVVKKVEGFVQFVQSLYKSENAENRLSKPQRGEIVQFVHLYPEYTHPELLSMFEELLFKDYGQLNIQNMQTKYVEEVDQGMCIPCTNVQIIQNSVSKPQKPEKPQNHKSTNNVQNVQISLRDYINGPPHSLKSRGENNDNR